MEPSDPLLISGPEQETPEVSVVSKEDNSRKQKKKGKKKVAGPRQVVRHAEEEEEVGGEQNGKEKEGGEGELHLVRLPGKNLRHCIECLKHLLQVRRCNLICSRCKKGLHKSCMKHHLNSECQLEEEPQPRKRGTSSPAKGSRDSAKKNRLRCYYCIFKTASRRTLINHIGTRHSHHISSPCETLRLNVRTWSNNRQQYRLEREVRNNTVCTTTPVTGTEISSQLEALDCLGVGKKKMVRNIFGKEEVQKNKMDEIEENSEKIRGRDELTEIPPSDPGGRRKRSMEALKNGKGETEEKAGDKSVEETRLTDPSSRRKRSSEEENGEGVHKRIAERRTERKRTRERSSDDPAQIECRDWQVVTVEEQPPECGGRPASIKCRIKVRKTLDGVRVTENPDEVTRPRSFPGVTTIEPVQSSTPQIKSPDKSGTQNPSQIKKDNCSLSAPELSLEPSANKNEKTVMLVKTTESLLKVAEENTKSGEPLCLSIDGNAKENLAIGRRIKVEVISGDEDEENHKRIEERPAVETTVAQPQQAEPQIKIGMCFSIATRSKENPLDTPKTVKIKVEKPAHEPEISREASLVETAMIDNSFWYLSEEENEDIDDRITREFGDLIILAGVDSCPVEPEGESVGVKETAQKRLTVLPLREMSQRRSAHTPVVEFKEEPVSELKQDPQSVSPKKLLHCKVEGCPFTSFRLNCLNIHVRSHFSKNTRRMMMVDRHRSDHRKRMAQQQVPSATGSKVHECELCHFRTSKKNYLVRHRRNHDMWKCSVCGHCAFDLSALVRHERTHSGERPFACNQCPYKAALKGTLVRHMRTHQKGHRHFSDDSTTSVQEQELKEDDPKDIS